MKNLLFVSRVAFLCNGCMLLSFIMRYTEIVSDKDFQSTVIITGLLLSFLFNTIAVVWTIFTLAGKQGKRIRPLWLFIVNFLCFIFQLYFLSK